MKKVENPWKAIVAYEDNKGLEPDYNFLGRDKEAREIVSLLMYNSIVTLYGNSSVGKTSLLNAAVFPLLRQKGLNPIIKRLNSEKLITEFVCSRHNPKSVYVLDQFEEVFRTDRETTVKLIKHMAEISIDNEDIKFLICIRQDDIYLLEEILSNLNLDFFRNNRYYLPEFEEGTARDVVKILGKNYIDPCQYTQIETTIIEYVKNMGDEKLNPMILSLVCHILWEKAPENKIITLELVNNVIKSENILEDYYNDCIKDLNRYEIVWLEESLLDKNGRRKSVRREDIPSKIRWEELTAVFNRKGPILSLSNCMVEFVHDRLASAAWSVKKSRGDERRPFIGLWCVISIIFYIWGLFNAWAPFNNELKIFVKQLFSCIGSISLILLPLLWAVGLEKCQRKVVGILGFITLLCVLGINENFEFRGNYLHSQNCNIIQLCDGIVGVILLIFSLVKKNSKKTNNKSFCNVGTLFKRLWFYHPSFRMMWLVCIIATFVYIKMLPIIGGMFDYLFIGGMLYFVIFPKIKAHQILPSIIYFVTLTIVAASDFYFTIWTNRSFINSIPIFAVVILSVILLIYSILKWKKTLNHFYKIILTIVSGVFLACNYVFCLGFNPFNGYFFDTYISKYRISWNQTIAIKHENGLYSINGAWTGEQLVPPIIKEIEHKGNLTNGQLFYGVECEYKNITSLNRSIKLDSCNQGSPLFYDRANSCLKFSETLISPFSYSPWFKFSYNAIEKGYYEFLSQWLNSIATIKEPVKVLNLNAVNETVLNFLKEYNYKNITDRDNSIHTRRKLDINEKIKVELRKNLGYKKSSDIITYNERQCQALCTAIMLDYLNSTDMDPLIGLYSLYVYQTLFLTQMPPWLNSYIAISEIRFNPSLLFNKDVTQLLEVFPIVMKANSYLTQYFIEGETIRDLLNLINLYSKTQKSIMLLMEKIRIGFVESTLNSAKLDSLTKRVLNDVESLRNNITIINNKKYRYLNEFFNVSLQPEFDLNINGKSKLVGGLYWQAFNASFDRFILKRLLYDELAFSALTNPQTDYLKFYFGSNYVFGHDPKSIMDFLTYEEEGDLCNYINKTRDLRNQVIRSVDIISKVQEDLASLVSEIKKLDLLNMDLNKAFKESDTNRYVNTFKKIREKREIILSKLLEINDEFENISIQ